MVIIAEKTTIDFGDITLDCLQFPDGSYHFYIRQIYQELGILAYDKTGKKYAKPLIDKDPKRMNEKVKVKGHRGNPMKTYSLELTTELIGVYASIGNKKCQAIAYACMAEALERRADAAFNVQRTEEERNSRFAERITHLKNYHPNLTKWLKEDGCTEGWQYGKAVNEFKTKLNLPLISVDEYNYPQLSTLNRGEHTYDALRKVGLNHKSAMSILKD